MATTTWHLEMESADQLRPRHVDHPDLRIDRLATPCPEFNKFLHMTVGHDWRWDGRQRWSKADWYAHVDRDQLETWVAYVAGTPAGYFELEKRPEGDVAILSFGLMPAFIGQGLGGHLLTVAVERAWEWGATRVSLTTCSHDHPHALKNYLARGFRISKQVEGPPNPPVKSIWD